MEQEITMAAIHEAEQQQDAYIGTLVVVTHAPPKAEIGNRARMIRTTDKLAAAASGGVCVCAIAIAIGANGANRNLADLATRVSG